VQRYARHFSTVATPQREPIPGRSDMVQNNAGGFVFAVDDWKRLERFLILGNEGGSYYAKEKEMTVENAQCVIRCLDADPARTVSTIVSISRDGRAPKNDPAIFALAIAAGHANPVARRLAEEALPDVCRIGTHLFQFVDAVRQFRGWGKGLRRAVARWYETKTPEKLAYQLAKYQQRDGMSHRDVLRLSHADPQLSEFASPEQVAAKRAALRWAVAGQKGLGSRSITRTKGGEPVCQPDYTASLPSFLDAVDRAKTADRRTLIDIIINHDLPRECVPTEALNDPDVWAALLPKMPLHALVRNLGKMSKVGLLKPLSSYVRIVSDKLADAEYIRASRLHPLAILLAAKVYGQGHGEKGKLTWTPCGPIDDALDSAFYKAFDNVAPTGKAILVALDVSGSMGSSMAAGSSISCREASAVLAMVVAKKEPNYAIVGFCNDMSQQAILVPIDISGCSRLVDVVAKISNLPFGGTDCSLPMRAAQEHGWGVDCFQIYTDSETWAGPIHASQSLKHYRNRSGRPHAKCVVVGMTATKFTIADPNDAGMLDCVGLDASLPSIIDSFVRD
jgi:60 kDa SS-A/Ro ribonucleoprotein